MLQLFVIYLGTGKYCSSVLYAWTQKQIMQLQTLLMFRLQYSPMTTIKLYFSNLDVAVIRTIAQHSEISQAADAEQK